MAPATKTSGENRFVLTRHSLNLYLAGVPYQLTISARGISPSARAYYYARRGRRNSRHQVFRACLGQMLRAHPRPMLASPQEEGGMFRPNRSQQALDELMLFLSGSVFTVMTSDGSH